MPSTEGEKGRAALFWLTVATAGWGVSFALIKAVHLVLAREVPGATPEFGAGFVVVGRMLGGALLLGLWLGPQLRRLTRREWEQGLGLGICGGLGLLWQMRGLEATEASTSAFLTQAYCVVLPLVAAVRTRRWPGRWLLGAIGLVILGMAVLTGLRPSALHLGRGEIDTLVSAMFFAGQIQLLEEPRYRANRPLVTAWLMFVGNALLAVPWLAQGGLGVGGFFATLTRPDLGGLILAIVFCCTLLPYLLMNLWQPKVSASQAGLLYCAEPVFAALFALFLPSLLAAWTGIRYANETATAQLLWGGALILLANLLLIWKPVRPVADTPR